jgi:hypothetical protein
MYARRLSEMMTKSKIIKILLIISLVLTSCTVIFGETQTVKQSDEPLDIQRDIAIEYALTPEDEEWADKTPDEIRTIINISQSIVEKLSDKELLDEVLEYPYIGDILAFDDVPTGLEVVSERFTGLSELLKRNSMGASQKIYPPLPIVAYFTLSLVLTLLHPL